MTNLYRLDGETLVPMARGKLSREELIEVWVARQPDLLGLDMLVIGRQLVTDFGGRIDLLGIDAEGNTVIVELKRDRTPREIIAQVLDYASWIAGLTTRQIHEIAFTYLGQRLDAPFRTKFETALPQTLNETHTMVIVASEFDPASQRIVRYLSEVHDVAINTAFFTVFQEDGETLLTTDWLLDQTEVVERSVMRTKPHWSGIWYVNVGDGPSRSWDDMRRYGFIAAGDGERYSKPLQRLSPGDRIVAYQKKAGYVGYGKVTSPAVMARDFETPEGPILMRQLAQSHLGHDRDDPMLAEYLVGVNWISTVPVAEAKWFEGLFANQNIVCKLRDEKTLNFLREKFGIEGE